MQLRSLAVPACGLTAAFLLLLPSREARAYSTIGGTLSAESERDFRVFNNFSDVEANDNQNSDVLFPGWFGADMAVWKAGVEWGSELRGDGTGDFGSGGANFDFYFAGASSGVGGTNDNIASTISSCGGSTLAYVELPISNGWRMRFCDNRIWSDGPGVASGSEFSLQGVATHEFGHALGLGHSFTGTVMQPSTPNGNNQRQLAQDDMDGVQFLYGVASSSKPSITGVSVDLGGNTMTITGTDFSTTGNEVWFTNVNSTSSSSDPRIRLTGISSTGGGTSITVTIPANAGPGDILVKQSGTGFSTLSNAYPADPTGVTLPDPISISAISPSICEALIPGTEQTIVIAGVGFSAASAIQLDGVDITTGFTFVDDTQITLDMPEVATLGAHTITVVDDNGTDSDTAVVTIVANSTPALQTGNGDDGNVVVTQNGVDLIVAGLPGEIQFVVTSDSNVPSVLPGKISLDLGNNFLSYGLLGPYVIGSDGLARDNIPIAGLSFLTVYAQSFDVKLPLSANYPLAVSNLQEFLILL